MTDTIVNEDAASVRSGKAGLFLGLVLAVVSGALGFAYTSGKLSMYLPSEAAGKSSTEQELAFVPIEPITVSVGPPSDKRYLRFRAELEVHKPHESDVEAKLPRVVDVLNTYLQSLKMDDIEDPASLLTLRSQMRRRVDLVVGGNKVHDLLIMEFVVS